MSTTTDPAVGREPTETREPRADGTEVPDGRGIVAPSQTTSAVRDLPVSRNWVPLLSLPGEPYRIIVEDDLCVFTPCEHPEHADQGGHIERAPAAQRYAWRASRFALRARMAARIRDWEPDDSAPF